MIKNKRRKCVIDNYIPRKTPRINNYDKWFEEYYKDLVNMFEITRDIINTRYEKDKILSIDDKAFNIFCEMIYNSSSKHIYNY
jgi:hypothetical protein